MENINMLKNKLATINKELAEINVPIFCGLDAEGFPRYLDSISIITDDDNNTVIGIMCIPQELE